MKKGVVEKNGAQLRAVVCPKCGDKIVHPADLNCLNRFNDLKDKKFNVKLRMVGNSHAISIPKEIFEFMEDTALALDRLGKDGVDGLVQSGASIADH